MSDQHKHEQHGGGHEMDAPPTRQLFNIVWGLGIITFLSIVTCVQLFNKQRDAMLSESLEVPSYRLAEYRKSQDALRTSNGTYELNDNGKVVVQEYVPLEVAKKKILASPDLLKAPPPPAGWIHPDDIASGGGAAAPVPAAPPAAPAEGAPSPSAPAEGAAEGAAAAPAGADKPAGAGTESEAAAAAPSP